MTAINATSTATAAATDTKHAAATKGTSEGAVSNPNATLDKDGFLKLFVAQLTHQDPTSPMDTNDSINQMASFSMVEGMTNMQQTNSQIASSLGTSSAVGLIGRTVSYIDADGNLQTGKVERVATTKDGQATLTVGGKNGIDPTKIAEVSA
jgi:flagellar basal-body rod modification protein FlgD